MSEFDEIEKDNSDELEKANELKDKLADSLKPIKEQQERLAAMAKPLTDIAQQNNALLSSINFESPAIAALQSIQQSVLSQNYRLALSGALSESMTSLANQLASCYVDIPTFHIAETMKEALASSVANSMQGVLTNFAPLLADAIRSPFIGWLHTFDFTPLTHIWENWSFDPSVSSRYDELDEIYLRAMYDAKWFPYAGWIADEELFAEISEILSTSRGMSKRCEKRIDKAILSYYTKAEIKNIKRDWKESDLEPHIKKALGQVLEAYLRKEYALVIPFLATMWEGLIKSKSNESKKQKEIIRELVDENGYDDVFSDFYNNLIIGTCYGVEDVIDGVPNRNSVAHSWYPKYPNQKAALNAILLTDFILNLKPKNDDTTSHTKQEDVENG